MRFHFIKWLYTILLALLTPFLLLRLWWKGRHNRGYRRHVGERLGKMPAALLRGAVWFHAVSLGEARLAVPFIERVLALSETERVIVTTTTPTGRATLENRWPGRVQVLYTPWDLPGIVVRFLRSAKPRLLCVMETELWPNLLMCAKQFGIPTLLLNARISTHSYRGYRRIWHLVRPLLQSFSCICAQDEISANHLRALGAPADRLRVCGNVKLDNVPVVPPILSKWRLQLAGRLTWVAGSTHAPEETLLLPMYLRLRARYANVLWILVPRHVERADELQALCEKAQLRVARRSQLVDIPSDIDVLLGDTIGEMALYYGLGDIVFVGGSLIPHGGQNMLEPIALGKPTVVGPHTHHFTSLVTALCAAEALQVVKTADELGTVMMRYWDDAATLAGQVEAGLAFLRANQGAVSRQWEEVLRFLH